MVAPVRRQIQTSLLVDFGVAILLAALLYALLFTARHWEAPLQTQVEINLSLWALPGYAFLSLLREMIAYAVSLVFTLFYGYIAAHQRNAERVMVPLLDVLQSIPVLGFLPGLVLALVALFPKTNVGLELASILMIFTGQVWNMTFSFYQSLRSIPADFREAASMYQFNWWQRFIRLKLPASAVGLAWNSMMSMAGGWFFLMICESFTLGSRDFRLPGLGSYMSVAIARGDVPAILSGIAGMVLMILFVNAFLWGPILVWAQRFAMEETAPADAQKSRVLQWLQQSWFLNRVVARLFDRFNERFCRGAPASAAPAGKGAQQGGGPRGWMRVAVQWIRGLALLVILWAASRFILLLSHLTAVDWGHVALDAAFTLLRVTAAVILGTLWTVPLGIWIGRSRSRCSRFQPFVQVAASFPAPMLYPLILLSLRGMGWQLSTAAVLLMLLGTQWYILFNVIAGASFVPEDLRQAAQMYRFTPLQRWWIVWWPGVFPYLITGWITAAGGAWNASIVAEYLSAGNRVFTAPGLGSLISVAAAHGEYAMLAAGVFTMALIVILMNRFFWKRLYRFAEIRYAY